MAEEHDVDDVPLCCDECGKPYFLTPEDVAHHIDDESPDGIDHDADCDHVPYGGAGGGDALYCEECGKEIPKDGDGHSNTLIPCPKCGHCNTWAAILLGGKEEGK